MWVEQLGNGKFKFVERYKNCMTGKEHKVSVTLSKNTKQTQKMAASILDDKIKQAIDSVSKPISDITLSELVEAYETFQKNNLEKSTHKRNKGSCNSIMKLLGEDILVSRLSARYVREKFSASNRENSTLNEFLTRFKALIRWGYKNDYIEDIRYLDKLEKFKDRPHKEKIQDKYLEKKELNLLLSFMNVERWKLLTEFLSLSGLRIGELCALTKLDVNIKTRTISVTKSYDPINKIMKTAKTTSSMRDVYIQDELLKTCKSINVYMLKQQLVFGYKSQLFFPDEDGGPVHYYTFNKYVKENAMHLVKKKITAHALRHTHASLLMESGMSIDAISRRLGHENSKITRAIYLHVTQKMKEKDNNEIKKISLL